MGRTHVKRKPFLESDQAEFLSLLAEFRTKVLQSQQKFFFEKRFSSASEPVLKGIDAAAKVLTGDETLFHAKQFIYTSGESLPPASAASPPALPLLAGKPATPPKKTKGLCP